MQVRYLCLCLSPSMSHVKLGGFGEYETCWGRAYCPGGTVSLCYLNCYLGSDETSGLDLLTFKIPCPVIQDVGLKHLGQTWCICGEFANWNCTFLAIFLFYFQMFTGPIGTVALKMTILDLFYLPVPIVQALLSSLETFFRWWVVSQLVHVVIRFVLA